MLLVSQSLTFFTFSNNATIPALSYMNLAPYNIILSSLTTNLHDNETLAYIGHCRYQICSFIAIANANTHKHWLASHHDLRWLRRPLCPPVIINEPLYCITMTSGHVIINRLTGTYLWMLEWSSLSTRNEYEWLIFCKLGSEFYLSLVFAL